MRSDSYRSYLRDEPHLHHGGSKFVHVGELKMKASVLRGLFREPVSSFRTSEILSLGKRLRYVARCDLVSRSPWRSDGKEEMG